MSAMATPVLHLATPGCSELTGEAYPHSSMRQLHDGTKLSTYLRIASYGGSRRSDSDSALPILHARLQYIVLCRQVGFKGVFTAAFGKCWAIRAAAMSQGLHKAYTAVLFGGLWWMQHVTF